MTSVGIWKSSKQQLSSAALVAAMPMSVGPISEQIGRAVARANGSFSRISMGGSNLNASSKPEALFDALVGFKLKTSRLASAHFTKFDRDRLFKQLDSLFDTESWDSSDAIASESSFVTLLRMVLFLGGRRPALGLTSTGNFIASWTESSDRLTVECKPNDQVRWVLTQVIDGEREIFASETNSVRLPKVLAPYEAPNRWFVNAIFKATS
jgi:hypothetical protein